MIARFYLGHPRPNLFNNAGAFVSEDTRRRWDRQMPVPAGKIRVAYASADYPNQHLIVVRITEFQLFNAEIPRCLKNDRGFYFHFSPPELGCFPSIGKDRETQGDEPGDLWF
jgi:hypothetical protein